MTRSKVAVYVKARSQSHLFPKDDLSASDLSLIGHKPFLLGHIESMVSTETLSSLALSTLSQASDTSSPIANRAPLRGQTEWIGENMTDGRSVANYMHAYASPKSESDVFSFNSSTDRVPTQPGDGIEANSTRGPEQGVPTNESTFH